MTLTVKNEVTAVVKPLPQQPITKLPPLTKAEVGPATEAAIDELEKQFEGVKIQKLGKGKGYRVPSLPTNLPTFDESTLTCGGLPDGRIIEIFGPESGGKTSICLHFIGEAQKAGGQAAFVDAEHALDPRYAKRLGVDIENLFVVQPDYGEQALEIVLGLIESRAFKIIVVDSVSALVPKAELDGDMGDAHMGLQARLMSQAMRKLVGAVYKTGTILIFINQVREKIGVMFGNPETTTGGRALKFYASVRCEVRRVPSSKGGDVKDPVTENFIGHRIRIVNKKNKVGPPFRETEVELIYEDGFNTKANWVDYAIELGIIKSGAWCVFNDEKFRRDRLENDPEIFEKVKAACIQRRDAMLAAGS